MELSSGKSIAVLWGISLTEYLTVQTVIHVCSVSALSKKKKLKEDLKVFSAS
jgi:hypothetical protein